MGCVISAAVAAAERGVHCVTGRELDGAHLLLRRAAILDVAEQVEAMAAQAAPGRSPDDAELATIGIIATAARYYAAQPGAGLEALAWVDAPGETERAKHCFPVGHPARPRLVPIDGGRG